MQIHVDNQGTVCSRNNNIKFTFVDDDKRNRYILSHIPSRSHIHQSKRYMKITINKNDLITQKPLKLDYGHIYDANDNKISEAEYNKALLTNLGFDIDANLFNKPDTLAETILTLGTHAINSGKIEFAKKLFYLANKKRLLHVAQKLARNIAKKRGQDAIARH